MSAISRLTALASDLQETAKLVEAQQHRIEHLERILRQAVMTHGGKLKVDVRLSDAAFSSKQEIWCGNGCIELLNNE